MTISLLKALAVAATLAGPLACMIEDRRAAADAAAFGEIIETRDALECYRRWHDGYPDGLGRLASPAVTEPCEAARRILIASRAGRAEEKTLDLFRHRWTYSPTEPVAGGGFRHYGLAAVDLRAEPDYRSFWVDDTGVVRSARGKRAGPGDVAESVQGSFRADASPSPSAKARP